MAADTALPIVVVNQSNLDRIENFFNDTAYKEIIESSVNFNTRLNVERRMRVPFIDTQTGVAQNPCSLFMTKRQRLPGLLPGQIYSYPRQRWRKKRRQYLTMSARAYARAAEGIVDGENDMHSISQIENPALQDTDSKDSQFLKDDMSKEWFYDEQDMLEMDAYDDPDPDSDLDYEETYRGRKRGKGRGRGGRGGTGVDSPGTPGRKRGAGRGRAKKASFGGHNYEPTPGDPDKPFACELCGARYKTRPGLTYHYNHSHKEGASDENSRDSNATSTPPTGGTPTPPQQQQQQGGGAPAPQTFAGGLQQNQQQTSGAPGAAPQAGGAPPPQGGPPPAGGTIEVPPTAGTASPSGGHVYQDSYVSFLNQNPGTPGRRGRPAMPGPNGTPPPGQVGPPGAPPTGPAAGPGGAPPTLPPNLPQGQSPQGQGEDPPMPVLKPENVPEGQGPSAAPTDPSQPPPGPLDNRKIVAPSPYCDFCLGDSTQNKKTGGVEELVSCSDCGRSGEEIKRLRDEIRAGQKPDFGQSANFGPVTSQDGSMASPASQGANLGGHLASQDSQGSSSDTQMPNIAPAIEANTQGSNTWQSGESSGSMATNESSFGPPMSNVGSPLPTVGPPTVWQEENANFGPMPSAGQSPHYSHPTNFGPIPSSNQPPNFHQNPHNFGPMSSQNPQTNYGPMSNNPNQPGNFGPMPNHGHFGNFGPMSSPYHQPNYGPMPTHSPMGHIDNFGPIANVGPSSSVGPVVHQQTAPPAKTPAKRGRKKKNPVPT